MLENIKNATEFAFSDNVADMASEIELAIQSKVYDALQAKKVEVAQSFMNPVAESEDLEESRYNDDFDDDWKDNSEVKDAESELRKMKIKLPNVQHKEVKISKASGELKGNQQKLDKNKNGKLDSQDFKKLRKESEDMFEANIFDKFKSNPKKQHQLKADQHKELARDAFDDGDEDAFVKHQDLHTYHSIKA